MTDKKKITLIYVVVGLITVLILGMSFFLVSLKRKQKDQGPPMTDVGKEEVQVLNILRTDIELERQSGEKVMISEMKDKVWVAAQFYAACPMCAKRNQGPLLEIYNDFKDDDDFMVACLSVDPENDTAESLTNMREVLKLQKEDWWFLKANRKELWKYMEEEMKFPRIEERFEPIHIAQKGRWAHDIGLQLYLGTSLVHKWDTDEPLDDLRAEIKKALADLKELRETSIIADES